MGMFSRFTDIINANLNNILDKAEDPEKMVKLIIQEMEETLVEVRSTAAKNIAEKKTLMRQIASLETSIKNWQEKAALAISKDRDDLAKSALHEKQKCLTQVCELQHELAQLDVFLSAVQEDGQRLQEKLQEAKRKQDAFVLRQASAEVRLKVRERAIVYNIDDAISKFERYQQKIDRVEAEIESYDFTSNKDLESQFRDLETDETIDQELADLKKQVVNG
ncbi:MULTISPECIES: phage shock protein PspA [unclassified Colwellia]|uniref:phage shock protein PspA n=1 Tax=unclassified Colwellia TaxID=196834 RepID=UPI0015F47DE6|nr:MULTISPECIES: phage shock protein PspA [unclassified Colwellia]MBA6232370.1 phage shock protein PspA [Colwellia sp. MB02u-7]MBA6236046.1 phage shock protein PspA [Colwellia sp. MB02u-11]MBA6256700.1 phage shock protein PspA [Colwellia sp. MB3u-28]MBA6261415.1 phage shock protein PspA [Colwellia sp. MB3u-41]MBA6298549.1 phage shock protein PspA [Colwellia sp. MB3u-22]